MIGPEIAVEIATEFATELALKIASNSRSLSVRSVRSALFPRLNAAEVRACSKFMIMMIHSGRIVCSRRQCGGLPEKFRPNSMNA